MAKQPNKNLPVSPPSTNISSEFEKDPKPLCTEEALQHLFLQG